MRISTKDFVIMNAIQVLVFLLFVSSCLSCPVLPQLPEGMSTSGSEVANKVLEIIECSGLFEDDHSFMRREVCACAARVTVVGFVCVCVCLSVC